MDYRSVVQEIRSVRFYILLLGILVNLGAGTEYAFSAYGPAMRDKLGYSQSEITYVSTAANVGLYVGFHIGMLYDKSGPRITASISGILVFMGYFLTFMALTIDALPNPAWLIAIFFVLVGQGSWGLYETALLTNMKNYRENATVTGLLVAAFALSSGMFTLICSLFFSGEDAVAGFILLMACFVGFVSVLAAAFMKVTQRDNESTMAEAQENDPLVPLKGEEKASKARQRSEEPQQTSPAADGSDEAGHPQVEGNTEVTGFALLRRLDFWLLWVPFLIGSGTGLMVINQLGEVVLSLGGDNLEKDLLVGTLSVSNFAGRVLFGFLSDRFARATFARGRFPRTMWLAVSLSIMGAFHLLFFLFQEQWFLGPVVVASGLSYGGIFATVPVLLGIFWGLKGVGLNFALVAVAPACGSIAFNQLAGWLYDEHTNTTNDDGDPRCEGDECFKWIFLITGSLCSLAVIIAGVLIWKKKRDTAVTPLNEEIPKTEEVQ